MKTMLQSIQMYETSPLYKLYLSNESEFLIYIHAGLKYKKKTHCLKVITGLFQRDAMC